MTEYDIIIAMLSYMENQCLIKASYTSIKMCIISIMTFNNTYYEDIYTPF